LLIEIEQQSTIEIMTRAELIKQPALGHSELTIKDIELAVSTIFDGISHALASGGQGRDTRIRQF
jgi:nucleoid DNA-binding protein